MIGVLHTNVGPMVEGVIYGATGLGLFLFSFWAYNEWAMQNVRSMVNDKIDERVERHEKFNHDDN